MRETCCFKHSGSSGHYSEGRAQWGRLYSRICQPMETGDADGIQGSGARDNREC